MPAMLRQGESLQFDLVRDTGGNLEQSDDLTAFVALCLFADRRVPDGVEFDGDRGGWWASSVIGDEWGSLLWTLRGAPNTPDNLRLSEQYAVEALQVLIDERIASSVRASAVYHPTEWGVLRVEILSGGQWLTVWENTLNVILAPNTH